MPPARDFPTLEYRSIIIAATIGAFALDLALSRLVLLSASRFNGMTLIPGLLAFNYAWNKGISFSLFWQSSSFGSWALALFRFVVALLLLSWATRTNRPLFSAALGSIAAGALGNVASRVLYGAVFDFLALHLGPIPLFVSNISDALISVGVAGLLVEILWPDRRFI